jgi:hypothetical protein
MSKTRVVFVAVVALLALPTASASALKLSDPVALPNSLPGPNQMAGGEPSLAFDPTGDGHLYSVAPNGGASDNGTGVNFWASADGGNNWYLAKAVGSEAGGGDSDVDVGLDHKVYVLDLEIASSAVCRSTDFGKTFGDGCETGAAQDQAGAEEDRQWLTHDPNDANTSYFNYHDLTLEAPIVEKSTDGGSSYTPCGNLIDPAESLFPSSIGNTIVGKLAAAKDGMLYVPIGAPTPTQAATAGSATPPYGEIVVAYHKGCNNDQFSNTTVYKNDGGSFSNLFISNAVGPDGTLYVVASGKLDANGPYNTYVWVSRDKGKSFSKTPIQVNTSDLRTNVMSAIAAGNKPGQVVVGWYGAQNVTSPDDTKGEWRYYLARSDDYGATWDRSVVTPTVFHYGDICTVGIACVGGGNRNLLDFSSVGVDPKTGCATTIFPGDPFDTPDREASGNTDDAAAYISREACSSKEGGTGSNGAVLGVAAGCHDHTPPVTTIARGSRFTRKGITLRGVARDRGCGPKGRGTVARVSLAISRRVGKKCQWLQPKGGFGKTGSCRKKTYVTAKGTSRWSFTLKARLKKGTYAVVPRAIDSVGNVEKPRRGSRRGRHNHNRYLYRVR